MRDRFTKIENLISLIILVSSLFSLLYFIGCSQVDSSEKEGRSDLVTIDYLSAFGKLDRPPVEFPHDLHTKTLAKMGKDCQTCHPPLENGRLSLEFGRKADYGYDSVMAIYHNKCISCHKEIKASGEKAGPTICGDCHQKRPKYFSTWTEIGFDKSLHFRHIKANEKDCGLCHHKDFDKQTRKFVYVKGEETTCRECHKTEAQADTISLSSAVHWECLGCHLKKEKAGPRDCAGCHSEDRRKDIKVIENPPRLKRNQPDFVLLSAPDSELTRSKLNTVPFPHKEHEQFNPTCRVCHHESMKKCVDCHSLEGKPTGNGTTLQDAMHSMKSNHSCIGCHNVDKSDTTCAGCHSLMEEGKPSEHSCNICHIGPPPNKLSKVVVKYKSMKQFKSKLGNTKLSFKRSDVPDSVIIKTLSDNYEPAVMPHRKIVEKLMGYIRDSKIATHFHGSEDVVCQGCHHYSPIGENPPLCESCHNKPFDELQIFKPGLKGAFHRQCIGCHQNMNLEKPADCKKCHKEKVN